MKYKLIAVDIDGTLLTDDRVLTEETINSIKLAQKNGIKVVLSTGRPLQGIKKFIEPLCLDNEPAILYNGAMVVEGNNILYSLELEEDVARKIAEEGHKRNSTMIMWSKNQLYVEKLGAKIDFYKNISGVEPILVKDLGEYAKQGITKYVWYDDEVNTPIYQKELLALIGDKVNIHPSRVDFLEFVNKKCSKATAIGTICKKYNIDLCETVAVGDGFNDLPMIEYCGLGVAMGNAPQGVKDKSDFITKSNNENGLSYLINKILEGSI